MVKDILKRAVCAATHPRCRENDDGPRPRSQAPTGFGGSGIASTYGRRSVLDAVPTTQFAIRFLEQLDVVFANLVFRCWRR